MPAYNDNEDDESLFVHDVEKWSCCRGWIDKRGRRVGLGVLMRHLISFRAQGARVSMTRTTQTLSCMTLISGAVAAGVEYEKREKEK